MPQQGQPEDRREPPLHHQEVVEDLLQAEGADEIAEQQQAESGKQQAQDLHGRGSPYPGAPRACSLWALSILRSEIRTPSASRWRPPTVYQ